MTDSLQLSPSDLAWEHFRNPSAEDGQPYPPSLRAISNAQGFMAARQVLRALPGYAPTPTRELAGLAARLGIQRLYYKDESARFGVGAFKGMGGAYALYRLLEARAAALGKIVTAPDLLAREYPELTAGLTVACGSTGNHGRSLARAAQIFGCACVIYVPSNTTRARIDALEGLGAKIVRVDGNYDAAVAGAEADARASGWSIISDTAYAGHDATPHDVMHGYRVIVDEVVHQIPRDVVPTHAFVQAGVGGIAAAFCAHFWETWGLLRPRFVVVESREAACLLCSAQLGELVTIGGDLDTRMAGLAAGRASTLAWEILRVGANDFVSIADAPSLLAMRMLAARTGEDPPVVAGEAGAAGLGALLVALSDEERRHALGLDSASRVMLIGTEGATDPASYQEIVGLEPQDVLNGRSVGID
ncbi:MAG: diaminopropionate ammonia-lyase [Steroidobacteraceae bacterium]